ncbi:MAG: hypothetical protein JW889_05455 [Verrucomicrobia bacterium]|nr:hypothetical protein [Verrucomicrobiota bacterium]
MTRYAGAVLFLAALIVFGGCGSNDKAIDELSREQTRIREQVRAETAEMAEKLQALQLDLRNVREWLRDLNAELVDVSTSLSGLREQSVVTAVDGGDGRAAGPATAADLDVVSLEGADLATVAQELARTRQQVADMIREREAEKELEALRDPRQAWDAMGDPEQLVARIDRFAAAHADNIEDVSVREQFLADVQALRHQIEAQVHLTPEQKAQEYRSRLTDLLNAETDERRRQWYEGQLTVLNSANEEAVNELLDRGLRMDNARAIGELANKYEVPRDTLRDSGLVSFGGGRGDFGSGGGRRDGGGGPARGGGTTGRSGGTSAGGGSRPR